MNLERLWNQDETPLELDRPHRSCRCTEQVGALRCSSLNRSTTPLRPEAWRWKGATWSASTAPSYGQRAANRAASRSSNQGA